VIDFGICRQTWGEKRPGSHTGIVAKFFCRAPEVHAYQLNLFGPGIDVWSCACIIYEIFVGRHLFFGPEMNDPDQGMMYAFMGLGAPSPDSVVWSWDDEEVKRMARGPHTYTKGKDHPSLRDVKDEAVEAILKRMFEYDPAKRISAAKALKRFFAL
jgi:serine/threonine protein kinase